MRQSFRRSSAARWPVHGRGGATNDGSGSPAPGCHRTSWAPRRRPESPVPLRPRATCRQTIRSPEALCASRSPPEPPVEALARARDSRQPIADRRVIRQRANASAADDLVRADRDAVVPLLNLADRQSMGDRRRPDFDVERRPRRDRFAPLLTLQQGDVAAARSAVPAAQGITTTKEREDDSPHVRKY